MLTSDYHARRAGALAAVILGGSGISFSLVALPSPAGGNHPQEGLLRCARDVARCLVWLLTGLTGGEVGRLLHPERFPDRLGR